jgi:hypothetical protein
MQLSTLIITDARACQIIDMTQGFGEVLLRILNSYC